MAYRKTKFSYIVWFLYTLLCIVLFAVCANVWMDHLTGVSGFAGVGLFVAVALAAPALAAALYRIVSRCSAWCMRRFTWKKGAMIGMECLAFLLILAGALLVRIMCLNDVSAAAAGVGDANIFYGDSAAYFDRAVVTQNGAAAAIDCGVGDLYVTLLSVALSFLGNRAVSAVFLQIVLQMIGLMLAYAATRELVGRVPACAATLYMAGSSACLRMLTCPGPEWLFFDLYLIGLYLSGSFVKSYCAGRMPKPVSVFAAAAVGAVIGALAYLDLTGASLFVFVLSIAAGRKRGQEGMPARNGTGMSAAVILTAIAAGAAVWAGAAALSADVSGTALAVTVSDRLRACYESSYLFTGKDPYAADLYLIGVSVFAALLLVPAFFGEGTGRNYLPWMFLCLLAAPTPMTVYGEHGFGMLSLYVWAVLAGLGLQNSLFGSKAKVMRSVIEEINTAAEQAGETTFIENPLPLPKRHVRRDMDFLYEVEEKDMKYDVEVSPDDDFDIK